MDEKELVNSIENGESDKLELKPSLSQINEIIETVSAMANMIGGFIVIGVTKSGRVIGVEIGKDTIERLSNKIINSTEPKTYPRIWAEKVGGKEVIIIEVKESENKPVLAFGRPFKRVGKSTMKVSKDEHERMVMEKHKDNVQFDNQICTEANLKDIDREKLKWFLRKAKSERDFDADPETPIEEALEKLGLSKNGKLKNSGILLFGKKPQKFFVQARIRCARFKGVKSLDFIDMKIFDGTIPEQRENAVKFITQHIRHAVYFDANRRYDRWEYPLRALEEAITNALVHRDYFSNGEIQLSIFDDRIEIWNPGELPKPLTPEDLKRKHKSIPRNKLIADSLFLIKYIEKWGTGTNRMIEEMLKSKLPEPEFQNLSGGFEVSLAGPGKSFEEEIEKKKIQILEINERQRKALGYLKGKGRITRMEYCKLNDIGATYAKKELNDLIAMKIIRRVGKGKSTYYILVTE